MGIRNEVNRIVVRNASCGKYAIRTTQDEIMDKSLQSFYSDPDMLAEGLLGGEYFFDPGGDNLSEAERQAAGYTLRWWRNEFYLWKDGCYKRISDSEINAQIKKHLHCLNNSITADASQRIRITSNLINNISLCLAGMEGVHIPEGRELNTWDDGRERLISTIAVKNGLLMTDKKQLGFDKSFLARHTPRYFNLVKLPYDYDPQAKCPDWEIFLEDVMLGRGEYIDLLQRWVGYLFRPDLKEQKFLLCTGEGANGKGVFFEVIQALVGRENCCQIGLRQFAQRFALNETIGKVVNITHESSHIIEEESESNIKSFVAGDTLMAERKFKDAVSFVPTAKLMISTNSLPRFNDKTNAIWRRILLVPFDKIIDEKAQIKELAEILKESLPGILNWALEGLAKLNQSGFVIPQANKELMENYRRESDPARAFLLETYKASDNGGFIPCKDVYNAYRTYCAESGCLPMGSASFGHHVRRLFPNVERKRLNIGTREWIYYGLMSQVSQLS